MSSKEEDHQLCWLRPVLQLLVVGIPLILVLIGLPYGWQAIDELMMSMLRLSAGLIGASTARHVLILLFLHLDKAGR